MPRVFRICHLEGITRARLAGTVRAVRLGLERIGFDDPEFRRSKWIRLRVLDEQIRSTGRLPFRCVESLPTACR
jgi:hypothetical protein